MYRPDSADHTRREFLHRSASLAAAGGVLGIAGNSFAAAPAKKKAPIRGRAEHCILIWLAGGACHVDTWDPKRKSTGRKDPGSYYNSVPTAISG